MKFLLDACAASRTLKETLVDLGHDVRSAQDEYAHASDETLLALAYEEHRVLITEDKDFGELVFLRRRRHPCIIRLVELRVAEKVRAIRELIEQQGEALRADAIIVVTRSRVRIRPAGFRERDNGS